MKENKVIWEEYRPYFNEIRKRLLIILSIFIGGGLFGIIFSNKIILLFLRLFNFSGINIVMTSPSQLINLSVYTGIIFGVVLSSPVLVYSLFEFIGNALTRDERKLLKKFLPISVFLFILGTVFGAWVTQLVIMFFSKYSSGFQVSNIWDIQMFFSQVIVTALIMGFVFQMPLILTILIRLGLIKRSSLVCKRKYIYAGIMLVSILLPTTDIVSLLFETVPLLFLFEIALLLNRDY